jgi:hypothetical protein
MTFYKERLGPNAFLRHEIQIVMILLLAMLDVG